jgi:uncharacterized protein YndB with AHSA1/START domain
MQPKGTLVEEGELANLNFLRHYRHSAERVWAAIATPEGLRHWLMCSHAEVDGRVGGKFEMISGPSRYLSTGKILAWDPPRTLEYEWKVAPVPEMPQGEDVVVRYELTPEGDSTRLRVTYRRLTRHTARGFLPGLHAFLERLEAQLDQNPLPAFERRFGELIADYPQWIGHAPASRQ